MNSSSVTIPENVSILVVDDEASIAKMISRSLSQIGFISYSAGNADEALAMMVEHPFDVVITDVVMPEMDGRDLSSRLTRLHPALKTLYMSGYTADVIAHHGVLDEGVQFIQKPFSFRDLAAKVREVVAGE